MRREENAGNELFRNSLNDLAELEGLRFRRLANQQECDRLTAEWGSSRIDDRDRDCSLPKRQRVLLLLLLCSLPGKGETDGHNAPREKKKKRRYPGTAFAR